MFVEAVPSTLVMTYLMVRAGGNRTEGSEIIYNWHDRGSTASVLFFVAYSTSIITSSLSLAKNMKVGPCRILPEQKKHLGGLLSPRFVLLFFACGFTHVGKGLALASAVDDNTCDDLTGAAALAVSICFFPGFLIGLFACQHRGILKTFLVQPSVFLLPLFSHFTFTSNSKFCCQEAGVSFISFSPTSTAVNAGVSIAGILVYSLTPNWICSSGLYLVFGLPCSILGLVLTLVAAFSNRCNCCKSSSCCCLCCCESLEFGALSTTSPHIPYIIGPDGQLLREADIEADKEEEVEEPKDNGDLVTSFSSASNSIGSGAELKEDMVVQEEESDQLDLSVHIP